MKPLTIERTVTVDDNEYDIKCVFDLKKIIDQGLAPDDVIDEAIDECISSIAHYSLFQKLGLIGDFRLEYDDEEYDDEDYGDDEYYDTYDYRD